MDCLKRIGFSANDDSNLDLIPLRRDRTYRIGRDYDQEIRILDDMISREHSVLSFFQQAWHVQDRRSLNKTHVNDVPLFPFQV